MDEQALKDFRGQYFDAETGLHCNYFCDCDSSTGRYIESDPIGLDGGLNTYLYADANPVRHTDPTGQFTEAGLGTCVLGGPFNPVCDVSVIVNACKWTVIIGASIMLSGDSCDGDSCPQEDAEEDDKGCEAVCQSILATCSGLTGKKKFQYFEAARVARE